MATMKTWIVEFQLNNTTIDTPAIRSAICNYHVGMYAKECVILVKMDIFLAMSNAIGIILVVISAREDATNASFHFNHAIEQ